jgi:hypothetical protein
VGRTVARLLAESLEAHDVDQIYCVPGESYVGLTSELLQRNSMRVVVCRHETGVSYIWRSPMDACAAVPGWRWCRAGRHCHGSGIRGSEVVG